MCINDYKVDLMIRDLDTRLDNAKNVLKITIKLENDFIILYTLL